MTDHAAVLQDQLRQIRLVDGIQDTPYTRAVVAAIAALAAPKVSEQADPAPAVAVPAFGIDTANHANFRIRGFTAGQVQEIIADHARIVAELREEVAKWRTDATEIANGAGALVQAAEQRAEAMAGLLREARDCLMGHLCHTAGVVATHELGERIDAALTGQATPEGA